MKYLLAGVRAGHINNSATLGPLSGMLSCIYGVEGRGEWEYIQMESGRGRGHFCTGMDRKIALPTVQQAGG